MFITMQTLFTAISFLTFVGIAFWAYSRRQQPAFQEAAMLPFADEPDEAATQTTEARHG